MLNLLRRLTPRGLRRRYHYLLAKGASWYYGRPSRRLVVIGVTGTDGKTTTAALITHLLTQAGRKVGLSSSVMWRVADQEWLNESHLTMPGRFSLQRLLRRMVNAGCQYAVIEVSSEGLAQNRHIGIDFDVAVLTNLTPEHIEAHGSFEAYRRAKERLFSSIIKGGDKHLFGQTIPKVTVVNLDDAQAEHFLQFWAERHYAITLQAETAVPTNVEDKVELLRGKDIHLEPQESQFSVDDHRFHLPLPGQYNINNAVEALAVARALGLSWEKLDDGFTNFGGVLGRGQNIPTGQPWRVIVDYALTTNALEHLYQSLQQSGAKRIIAVFGAAGGGRDAWKRPELGKIAAKFCDHIILTTDDPYTDDPQTIAQEILGGVPNDKRGTVEIILDRRAAIQKALHMAKPGDVVAITGMGSETSMMIKGQKVPWSDADVVEGLLVDETN